MWWCRVWVGVWWCVECWIVDASILICCGRFFVHGDVLRASGWADLRVGVVGGCGVLW